MKIASKMILIGCVVVTGLLVITGVFWQSNHTVNVALGQAQERSSQLEACNDLNQARLDIMLAAMDAIVDKAKGRISEERLATIQDAANVMTTNLNQLLKPESLKDKRTEVESLRANLPQLLDLLTQDLPVLIEENGITARQTEAAFARMDDLLDQYAERVSNGLASLSNAFQEALSASADSENGGTRILMLASNLELHLIQVQQWLTDISATRAAEGFDDGYDEAQKHATAFRKKSAQLMEIFPDSRQTVEPLLQSFDRFYEKGKWMASQYVEGGPNAGNKAMGEFDAYAERIGKRLEAVTAQTATEAKKTYEYSKRITLVDAMAKAQISLMLAAMDALIDKDMGRIDDERMASITKSLTFLRDNMDALEAATVTPEEKGYVNSIRKGIAALDTGIKTGLVGLIEKSAVQTAAATEAFEDMDRKIDEYGKPIATSLRTILQSVANKQEEASNELASTLNTSKATTTAASVITLGVLICILALVSRSILGPIKHTVAILRDLAEGNGDLTKRLDDSRSDELGEMGKWFNGFVDKLRGVICNIAGNANTLAGSSTELTATASRLAGGAEEAMNQATSVSAAAEEMSINMNNMATSSEQMSTNVKSVASAVDGITASVTEIAKNAEQAASVAEEAAGLSRTGNESIGQLDEAADAIGKVIETIQDIAEQTNLLALNATIEAARAGDAGKGFAVVANEVKELAKQTAEATEDIRRRIESIQNSTGSAVTSIGQIEEVISKVNEVSRSIASAVEEQRVTTEEIAQSVAQTASAAETVSTGVGQSAVAIQEINKNITDVDKAARQTAEGAAQTKTAGSELSKLGDQLQSLVGKFKV